MSAFCALAGLLAGGLQAHGLLYAARAPWLFGVRLCGVALVLLASVRFDQLASAAGGWAAGFLSVAVITARKLR